MDERTPAREVEIGEVRDLDGDLDLDLGVLGDQEPEEGPPPAGLPRRPVLLALGAAAVAGVGALAHRSGTTPARPAAAPATPTPTGPVVMGRLARPIAGPSARWQLFGLGRDVVVRIDPASGAFTRTRVPPTGDGQVCFVPLRRGILVRPLDTDGGVVVLDDQAPFPIPVSRRPLGVVLPGPDPDHLWTRTGSDDRAVMRLIDVRGQNRPVEARVPQFATTGPMTDGAGGLLFEGVGGLYRIGPEGRLATSNAIVLAVGAGTLLTLSHGADDSWSTVLQPRTGRARRVPVPIGPQLPHGVLAPDAARVVLYSVEDRRRRATLTVVDLPSGAQRPVDVDITGVAGEGTVLWSPRGRRLFCLDAGGHVRIVDPATGGVLDTPDLPPLRQLALRRTT